MITNEQFLRALFGDDSAFVHVTDFKHDPSNIPKDQHLRAWRGDWFSRYPMQPETNQYFTISIFGPDEQGTARRRKNLYYRTPVIVLDDVREKLDIEEAQKLPEPAWILETSGGSEQWGYILDTPESDRGRVENLLDGLVANGLAPGGRDPGMKGVTRYVRLPEGVNNKASKLVDGQPFKCQLIGWNPERRTTLEDLAAPFQVDLSAARRESRVDGAAAVSDHPLLHIPDIITVKEVRSDGRFDVTCPWVDEHTGGDDSGSAVFTNSDGSIGFKCHHGNCQEKTGADLLRVIEQQQPGFGGTFAGWKAIRSFADLTPTVPDFSGGEVAPVIPAPVDGLQMIVDQITRMNTGSQEARALAGQLLQAVEELPVMEQMHWHQVCCDQMGWSKAALKTILKDLRETWYTAAKVDDDFYAGVVYVKEQNQFYEWRSRAFMSAEAFQNSYAHRDAEARKSALVDGRVQKVDRLDYAPRKPRIFTEKGVVYGNAWSSEGEMEGVEGDVSRWLSHWDALGWSEYRDHHLKFMAYTLLHPEHKINHILLLGGGEGCGKDFLIYPFINGMGENSLTISGEELLGSFDDYLMFNKLLNINEIEMGNREDAAHVSTKLKPLATAPPDRLRVNQKGIKPLKVRNIVNVVATTNSSIPIKLSNGPSRRIHAVWSDLTIRGADGQVTQEWLDYWNDRWAWMRNGGVEAVIWYLRNCVDITDFNPAEPPQVTQFLKDIQESSKTPLVHTVEAFIEARAGAFASDLLTASDAAMTLKMGDGMYSHLMHTEGRGFSPVKVGQVLKELGARQLWARRGNDKVRLWVVRNVAKYAAMDTNSLYDIYEDTK
ncbi:MAG: DUF5906 domain-containing protein [Pontibacterium sp.]